VNDPFPSLPLKSKSAAVGKSILRLSWLPWKAEIIEKGRRPKAGTSDPSGLIKLIVSENVPLTLPLGFGNVIVPRLMFSRSPLALVEVGGTAATPKKLAVPVEKDPDVLQLNWSGSVSAFATEAADNDTIQRYFAIKCDPPNDPALQENLLEQVSFHAGNTH
jgi:hypothetical protein